MELNRLELRVDAGATPEWPVLTVLVDGVDVIRDSTHGYEGFYPGEMLGGERPLVPTTPPRRVAVYRCSCGESACGVAACVVGVSRGVVTWSDFQDFTGVYVAPVDDDPLPVGGERMAVPDLAFAAGQYEAEVARLAADRSWESRRQRIARLAAGRLAADGALRDRGWTVRRVVPSWNDPDGIVAGLRRDGARVTDLGVRVVPAATDDAGAVAAVVAGLLDDPERWDVVYRNDWPAMDQQG